MRAEDISPSLKVKDSMQSDLISSINLESLSLQGGGALHHIYGSPRFSADLDYVTEQ